MIAQIIDLLRVSKEIKSENFNIAKGKYKLPHNWKELKNTIKRNI